MSTWMTLRCRCGGAVPVSSSPPSGWTSATVSHGQPQRALSRPEASDSGGQAQYRPAIRIIEIIIIVIIMLSIVGVESRCPQRLWLMVGVSRVPLAPGGAESVPGARPGGRPARHRRQTGRQEATRANATRCPRQMMPSPRRAWDGPNAFASSHGALASQASTSAGS
jgi:hypothetical protein